MRITRFCIGLALLFTGACAPVTGTTRPRGVHVPQHVLTLRELRMVTSAVDLWEVIQSLSPNFIQSRGELAGVAVDGVLIGDARALRQIDPASVSEVRRITGPDAFMRFGTRAPATVLLLKTRRG